MVINREYMYKITQIFPKFNFGIKVVSLLNSKCYFCITASEKNKNLSYVAYPIFLESISSVFFTPTNDSYGVVTLEVICG